TAHAMLSVFNPTSDQGSLTKGSGDTQLAQIYVQADNIPELKGGNAWMGRRYYKREDVHITDFFYWNPQGYGGGIEDYDIGGLKLSYALLRKDTPNSKDAASRHDIQLRGIGLNPNGSLELGASIVRADSQVPGRHNGWAFTVQHRQTKLFGDGWNKLALQFGVGPGIGLGSTGDLTNGSDVRRVRLVEGIYAQLTPKLGGMLTAVYQKDRSDSAPDQVWTSLGGRVTYGWTEHIKLQAELGHDRVKPSGGDARSLTKFTIAPTLAAAPGFWSRPELRLFYTYARWNDAARTAADANVAAALAAGNTPDFAIASLSSSGVFGGKTHGSTVGLQVEAWW
ncbi:MAG: carbohydrate porin, partial [Rhodocyclaceae bacterium]|nr:carbohydrate porin [Rhodocyclaceae bacterium]